MTTFFWGGTFVAGKWAVGEAPPFFVATLRFAIASIVLWALVAWRGRGSGERFPLPEGGAQWAGLFSLGLTGVFLYNFVFLTGLSWTSATNGSLIVAFNPLLTAVLSAWWLKERVSPFQAAGLLLALLGVGIVVTRGSIEVIRSLSFNHGDLLMLGAPLAWALYTIAGKKVLRTFPPLVATAYASLFGTLLLLPAAAFEGSLLSGVHRLTVYGWISVLQLAPAGHRRRVRLVVRRGGTAGRLPGRGLRQSRPALRRPSLRPDPFRIAGGFPTGGRDPRRPRSRHRYAGETGNGMK